MTQSVTYNDLIRALDEIGIGSGAGLMVHSSLKSYGHVDGGAETVLAALMDALTPAGTLLLPTFNHGAPFREDGPGVFDPKVTPTTNGIIPDTFWRMPGVFRSLNPTHAFAAWGQHAERYVANHHRVLTMGVGSPLDLLMRDGGFVLLMGVDYRRNTFHHVVETTTGAPCLGHRTEALPVRLADGRIVQGRTWSWRDAPCPLTCENRYADLMAARGLDRRTEVGDCAWIAYRMRDGYDLVANVLRDGLGDYPPCAQCRIRPLVSRWTVPTDWDEEKGSLLPNSTALTF